jgi:hypothetical protein
LLEVPKKPASTFNVIASPDGQESRSSAKPAGARSRIEGRLSEQTVDIRDAARALSRAFSEQIEELKRSKPNDPERLVEHDGLVAFFERMAAGLGDLADALDRAISGASDGKLESIFVRTAGKIAEQLHVGLMEWLDARH